MRICLLIVCLFAALPLAAEHRFIANQGNRLAIFDAQGKLEWDMRIKGSPHDMHMLDNGNLLTHQRNEVIEIDLNAQKVVWSFDAGKLKTVDRVEVHAIQPLKDGKVMIALSGEGKIFEIDRDGTVTHQFKMKINNPHPHRDTRLARKLDNGHYLVAHEGDGAVREYDANGKVIWEFDVPLFDTKPRGGHGPEAWGNACFSAVRMANGNTLISTGNGHGILEVTPEKKIVSRIQQSTLPNITLAWVTTLEVYENGDIMIGNCHAGPEQPQLVKINADHEVLWTFKDFKVLGNAVSNSQILDIQGKVQR